MAGRWEKKRKTKQTNAANIIGHRSLASILWSGTARCVVCPALFSLTAYQNDSSVMNHELMCSLFFYRSLFVICLLFLGKFPSSQSLFMVGCVCVQFRHKAPIAFLAMGAADRSQMKESCTWNLLLGAMNSTRVRRETSEKVSNFSVFIFGYRLPLESHSMREEMCYRMSSSTLGMRKITATF